MKLTNTYIQKSFTIKHKGKTYYVDFLDSDGYIGGFLQPGWEVLDEELEELSVCASNIKLYKKLIRFCIKHFNDYKPDYREDC